MATKQFLSTAETASSLGLFPSTIRRLIRSGDLPGRQVGRKFLIPADAVERIARGEDPYAHKGATVNG